MFTRSLLAIWKKDLQVWARHPLRLLSSLIVPCTYFIVVALAAQATGTNPVAVVNLDGEPTSRQIMQALTEADVFRIQVVDASTARQLYNGLQVAAIITIPAHFSQEVAAGQPAAIQVDANNFNADLADDIRRAVPDAITLYYQQLGPASPIHISVADQPLRPQNIQLFQYSVLPIVVLIISVNGIILAGMAAAREWEERTIKELLLAPCPAWVVIAGKVLAGFMTTTLLATALLVGGALFGLIPLSGPYWFSALVVVALSSLMSSGCGVAIGAIWQCKQPVSYAATLAAVWLFSLAGGIGIIFFEPQWLQAIAVFDPLFYAIHSLQQAVFYQSFSEFGRDCAMLAAAALGAVAVGTLAMQRGIQEGRHH
jgi:ABC-2 type transport system permease protein